jgi:hypothetical protein
MFPTAPVFKAALHLTRRLIFFQIARLLELDERYSVSQRDMPDVRFAIRADILPTMALTAFNATQRLRP